MNYGLSCMSYKRGTEKARQAWLSGLAYREGCRRGGSWDQCATKALMKWTPTSQARWEAEKEAKKAEAKKGPWAQAMALSEAMYSCPPPATPTMQEIQEMKERRVATKTPVLVGAKELSDPLFERMPTWVLVALGAGITLFLTRMMKK